VDGTETGWGRPAEPAPRWRALLDRARHGDRAADEAETGREEPEAEARRAAGGSPLPARPGRPFNPLDPRQSDPARGHDPRPSERRPVAPPVNPLDRRPGRAGLGERLGRSEPPPAPPAPRSMDPRVVEPRPLDPRPVNPLAESRRQSRIGEGFQARPAAEEPHNFFNPASRSSITAPIWRRARTGSARPLRCSSAASSLSGSKRVTSARFTM